MNINFNSTDKTAHVNQQMSPSDIPIKNYSHQLIQQKIQENLSELDHLYEQMRTGNYTSIKNRIKIVEDRMNALERQLDSNIKSVKSACNSFFARFRASTARLKDDHKELLQLKNQLNTVRATKLFLETRIKDNLKLAESHVLKALKNGDREQLSAALDKYIHIKQSMGEKNSQIAESLIKLGGDQIDSILELILNKEIENQTEGNLFRDEQTLSINILNRLQREHMKPLAVNDLGVFIASMQGHQRSTELNPAKIKPGDNLEANQKKVLKWSTDILQAIKEGLQKEGAIPPQMKKVYQVLHQAIEKKFGKEIADKHIGAFIFLRLINPSITVPQDFGLPRHNALSQRHAINVTKILQNVANLVTFGTKEQHMNFANEFIGEGIRELQNGILPQVLTTP